MASSHVSSGPQTLTSRPYRSKRARPCDLCRSRKVCCRIQSEPPCMLCVKVGAECTFVERPSKRQKVWDEQRNGVNANAPETPATHLSSNRSLANSVRPDEVTAVDRLGESAEIGSTVPVHHMMNDSPLLPTGSFLSHTFDELGFDFNYLANQYSLGDAGEPEDLSVIPSEADRIYFWNNGDNNLGTKTPEVQGVMGFDRNIAESLAYSDGSSPSRLEPLTFPRCHETKSTSYINSLDDKATTNAQYFGLSGESDPYLLRHYRYDAQGEWKFFKLSFRNAADDSDTSVQPIPQQVIDDVAPSGDADRNQSTSNQMSYISKNNIPVHFKISANELAADIQEETLIRPEVSSEAARRELYDLVCAEDGIRLIGLFLKYVFPLLPAISRSQLGITATKAIPSVTDLDKIPTHLLAAIYASSLIFCPYDDHLCVSNVYTRPSTAKMWRLVYEETIREIHTPHLSVVQAALLYLHKPRTEARSAAADTPFHWSFMGVILGLSSSLALHLDCQDWLIPPWEKRLRRRLWWMIYVEEKWRSLLGGFPTLISDDQWDVSELTKDDFFIDEDFRLEVSTDVNESETLGDSVHFRYLVKLSQIVEDVHRSFYTLRASRVMSRDFRLSISTAQPLRYRLKAWYSSLPASLQIRNRSAPENLSSGTLDFNSPLHLAYLSLEILLYRALLRPVGRRRAQIPSISTGKHPDTVISQDNVSTSPPEIPQQPGLSDPIPGEIHEAAEAAILAAENCARIVTGFVGGLDSRDFAGFWYSWSRIGFATMSNFTMLLLVQAPSYEHAVECKKILDNWRRTLRFQSKSFEQMNLGLLRLDAVHYSGIEKLWIIDDHVKQVLRGS